MAPQFRNRVEAGQRLAKLLLGYANRADVLVLALPRGGVPVGYQVAKTLNVPLDLCLVRKLGVPGRQELAMGAIAAGGIRILNPEVIASFRLSPQRIEAVAHQELAELERRDRAYRGNRPPPAVQGRTLILVDDGLATGATMRAAIATMKRLHPQAIIVAIPVAAPGLCRELAAEVERVVCLEMPEPLYAIGNWYEDFSQTPDAEVCELLAAQEEWLGRSQATVHR